MLPIRQRLAAFKRFARSRGFDEDGALFEFSDLTFAGGYAAGERLWRRLGHRPATSPTAVVAFSDVVAVGLLRFLDEQGIDVPGDVSVISFDGTAVGEYTHTSLSTVITPMYEIGKQAFDLLTGAMAGRFDQPQSLILPVELKLRESVAAAKRQRRTKAAGSKP